MVSTSKLLTGVATIGAVGGCAGAIYHFTKETEIKVETVKDRLTKAGYQVLDVDKDEGWDLVFNAYNAIENVEEIFNGSTPKKENKHKLKQKCREALSNNKDYLLASRWCVKEQTMKEMLASNGYTKLEKSGNSEPIKAKWKIKLSKFENTPVDKRNITVDLTGDEAKKIAALEANCTSLNIDALKTHADKEFEKKFNQAKEWCSEKTE